MDKSTIEYYDTYAKEYTERVKYALMHDIRSIFLNMLKPNDRIADIGCAGGRDIKIFEELGYIADGIDASKGMCEIASEYTGESIKCQDISTWRPTFCYGGIWASASLLHLSREEFFTFFSRVKNYLNTDGIVYFSMKADINDGYDEYGRYYLRFDKSDLNTILTENKEYKAVRYWRTMDSLKRGIIWENVIIKKEAL